MSAKTSILHPTRELLSTWREGDAEKVLAMIDRSDATFPGGGGWQEDAEEIERWLRHGDQIAAYVTEEGDRIVALCTLMVRPDQLEDSYIELLICDPEFHGKKHGKSVLHAVVEHVYRAGIGKVDLGTWAGNMKAVPLYKRTGFMWQPGSCVHMENFTPAARQHPLGAPFFARHDWYSDLQRPVDLVEDLVTRGKVKVYEYLWRAADGDFLRMVFDRQSWRPIEVETPELTACVTLPDEKLVAGQPHRVKWQITNSKSKPVQVFLAARGEPGMEIAHRQSLELSGSAAMEAQVTVDPEIVEKTRPPRAAVLTTELMFGNREIELAAGIDVVQAVEISIEGPRALILPTEPQQARLTLRSHLDRKCVAQLRLRPVHNLELKRRSVRVELGPHASLELPVDIRVPAEGGATLETEATVTVKGRRIATRKQRLDLLACGRRSLAGAVGESVGILCGGNLAVYASRKDGQFFVHHRLRGTRAVRARVNAPQFGPPFSWDDLFQQKAESWIDRDVEGVSLHLRTSSLLYPGLIVNRRIRLDRSPLVEVVDTVTNGGARTIDLHRCQFVSLTARHGMRSRRGAPAVGGIHVDPETTGARELGGVNLPDAGARWPEGWLAHEGGDGVVSAVIWDQAETVKVGGRCDLRQAAGSLAPGGSITMDPLHLLVTDGTVETARTWWQLLHGSPVGEEEITPPSRREPIELTLGPEPLIVAGDEAKARVSLTSAGTYKLDGHVEVKGQGLVRSALPRQEVSSLTVDRPVGAAIQIKRRQKKASGPAHIDLRFETDEAVYERQARVLVLPAGARAVEVCDEGDVFAMDNGRLRARVAPAFSASLISLALHGREYLNSSFPKGGQRGWRNPWHGGIHPSYGRLWGRLHLETFRARTVERRGRQGLPWSGVRLTCKVAQESARNHTLYIEYLMAPGADVLAVIVGRRNTVGEWLGGDVGFDLWPNLAIRPGKGHFHTATRSAASPKASPYWYGGFTWDWGGLVSRDGRALFTTAASPDCVASGWAEGPEGCALNGEVTRGVPAGASVEGVFFVLPAASMEDAVAAAAWSGFTELP
ncbi:MAG: hypothetical protein CME04_11070 [Gemmatimonadaceae bacterium]|jgi:GNAT superfamily N-acetyltransferase|nr:hypothetical protein [Gemmatimonadaceae bacterium]